MSDSAQKGISSKRKVSKIHVFPTEETTYKIDRYAGDVGTPEADHRNQKSDEH